jgi:hypothetical protein
MVAMKRVGSSILLGVLMIGSLGWIATEGAPRAEKEWKPKIKMTRLPVFPDSLIKLGITRGRVQLVIVISDEGSLVDWLATEATHREFANSIAEVIETWDFEGARSLNEPRGEAFQLSIDFTAESTARMTAGPYDMSDHVFGPEETYGSEAIRLATPSELDGMPAPMKSVIPNIPSEILGDNPKEAVFEFYINTDGSVHIPLLKSTETDLDERILLAAQNALWDWEFFPPTAKGKPVVVKASLPLVFSPKNKED